MEDINIAETIKTNEDSSIQTITLKKPINFEGKEYKELTLDVEDLTGKDSLNILKELNAKGYPVVGLLETNKFYLAGIAAKTAGVPYELIEALNIKDFSEVTMAAQSFLLG